MTFGNAGAIRQRVGICNKIITIETVEPRIGSEPQKTNFILKDGDHGTLSETTVSIVTFKLYTLVLGINENGIEPDEKNSTENQKGLQKGYPENLTLDNHR